MGFSRQEYWSGVLSIANIFFICTFPPNLFARIVAIFLTLKPLILSPFFDPNFILKSESVFKIQIRSLLFSGLKPFDFLTAHKVKVKVKLLSRVRTGSNPMDCSLPGSSVHGIFQFRFLIWHLKPFTDCIFPIHLLFFPVASLNPVYYPCLISFLNVPCWFFAFVYALRLYWFSY